MAWLRLTNNIPYIVYLSVIMKLKVNYFRTLVKTYINIPFTFVTKIYIPYI